MRRAQEGVTLIELMVAIAVLAILLAMAAPSFSDFYDRYRLRGAVDDVISLISNARTGAVKLNRQVRVTFDGSGADWCAGAVSAEAPAAGKRAGVLTPCDCIDSSPVCEVEGESQLLPRGKHRVAMIGAPADLTFDGQLGLATGSGGALGTSSVTFTSPTGRYDLRVDVSPLGQATVCVPSSSDAAVIGYGNC
ncbi:GspH/FimT family pseudopilin [Aerolutibacter ruishenii]|uniref:Type II secretion system protein H n=1 Tax=Aerolutibacter ruishenii TaxID=686800 RepID=A0A562LST0_9GAMM|nr:GspH/FimT family pseudopilin [Lysobacter ruishenii]TWI10697.1 type IV fimbrial biogenesis protein FimT [Lysobacter ruishenii]